MELVPSFAYCQNQSREISTRILSDYFSYVDLILYRLFACQIYRGFVFKYELVAGRKPRILTLLDLTYDRSSRPLGGFT